MRECERPEDRRTPVLITGSLSPSFLRSVIRFPPVGVRSDAHLVAALGVGWAHAVNTRFLLEMSADDRRTLRVAKSPMFPCDTFTYEIDERGATVVQVSNTHMRGEGREDTLYRLSLACVHHIASLPSFFAAVIERRGSHRQRSRHGHAPHAPHDHRHAHGAVSSNARRHR